MPNDASTVLNPGVGGDVMDETGHTVSGQLRKRPRVVIGGDSVHDALVDPLASAPAGTEYALPVRNIPSGTQAVSRSLERSTSGTMQALIVSTAAVVLAAANASRRMIVVANNGSTDIYLGISNTVTTTGSTMGIKLVSGGIWSQTADGLYTGDFYAIGAATASSHNVCVLEST